MGGLGKTGEDLAAKYYKNLGFKILDRNYVFPIGRQMGELDLVVGKGEELVFVEVKARKSQSFGDAFEAVDRSKQRKLVTMAKLYVLSHPQLADRNISIDVVAVDIDNKTSPVIILKNAIEDLN